MLEAINSAFGTNVPVRRGHGKGQVKGLFTHPPMVK